MSPLLAGPHISSCLPPVLHSAPPSPPTSCRRPLRPPPRLHQPHHRRRREHGQLAVPRGDCERRRFVRRVPCPAARLIASCAAAFDKFMHVLLGLYMCVEWTVPRPRGSCAHPDESRTQLGVRHLAPVRLAIPQREAEVQVAPRKWPGAPGLAEMIVDPFHHHRSFTSVDVTSFCLRSSACESDAYAACMRRDLTICASEQSDRLKCYTVCSRSTPAVSCTHCALVGQSTVNRCTRTTRSLVMRRLALRVSTSPSERESRPHLALIED